MTDTDAKKLKRGDRVMTVATKKDKAKKLEVDHVVTLPVGVRVACHPMQTKAQARQRQYRPMYLKRPVDLAKKVGK